MEIVSREVPLNSGINGLIIGLNDFHLCLVESVSTGRSEPKMMHETALLKMKG